MSGTSLFVQEAERLPWKKGHADVLPNSGPYSLQDTESQAKIVCTSDR